jgi:hypothetical protein
MITPDAPDHAAPQPEQDERESALLALRDDKVQRLERELDTLQRRHSAVKTILLGFLFLEISHFLARYTGEFLIVIFPVVSAILLVFGIYNYLIAEND